MEEPRTASVIKIVSPFELLLRPKDSRSTFTLQLKSTANKCFTHLLPQLYSQQLRYELENSKSQTIREEFKRGSIYLEGAELTSLYRESQKKVYIGSDISSAKSMRCFVRRVECLKLELVSLENLSCVTFYFSELKLIRVGNTHPRQMWERSQSYFREAIEGEFVELTVAGSQNYKEQINLFGNIIRVRDGANIRETTIADGYAELSKEAHKYLNQNELEKCNSLRDKAKKNNLGFWSASKNIGKSQGQTQELKYRQWEQWIKEGRAVSKLRNQDEELRLIGQELGKLSRAQQKMEHQRLKVVLEIVMVLFQNQFSKKYLKFMEDAVRTVCVTLSNLQIPFYQQVHNLDFIRSVNKMLIFLQFYHEELEKLTEGGKGEKTSKHSSADIEKCLKFIFKLCFLGNETFHEKVFGKKKEHDYESFNFEQVYLEGGFSSLSQCSDYEEADKLSRQEKRERKLVVAHQKVRANATSLMSLIFKLYLPIVENYWQLCVTSNVLTKEFLNHVKQLRISSSEVRVGSEEKNKIANLMRSNFGDHSLILLAIFERSSRVRANSLQCLLNMISNFQGKRLIASTESAYIEKLLKETRSSFIPKSFIIFSGLRNALYFLLFVLYHQKNLQVVILIFRTLCELCNNCTLVDKMSFEDGVGLLLNNYIAPLLRCEWSITELEELKVLCINFLSVLVSSSRKWPQIEQKYFLSPTDNLNHQLLSVIAHRKETPEDKVVPEIIHYFTRLCKHYYSAIFYYYQDRSVWSFLKEKFIPQPHTSYPTFVEEILKSHLDESQKLGEPNTRLPIKPSIDPHEVGEFLVTFIKAYCLDTTHNNYLHLLNCLTYVDYQQWGSSDFTYARSFILHCFNSFIGNIQTNKDFPSIDTLKANALVRLALIKILGYMSFCPEFQTEDIAQKAVSYLLVLSKQYKSFNSIVKITWGLSNWAKVPVFASAINQDDLRACLDYMMAHSGSQKEKVASNCTRGIGFFACNVSKLFNLGQCRSSIIKNLSHPIVKVRTNSTKTLLNLTEDLEEFQIKQLLPLLEQNLLKNNYHLQMESLRLLKKIGNPVPGKRLLGLFVSILKTLANCTTIEYEFSEIKTIRKLRFTVLCEIFSISQELRKSPELAKDVVAGVCEFLAIDCKNRDAPEGDSRITEVELQKSEEAETLIFNKKGGEKFNDDKVIESQMVNKGFAYRASEEELELILRIKEFCVEEKKESREWAKLQGLRVEGSTVLIEASALQTGEGGEQYQYIVME